MTTESNALTLLQFDSRDVRVVIAETGEPLFLGKDVADLLGYANAANAIRQHCRGVAKRYPIVDSLGRTQEARILSEADVLRLIVRSTLPAAERFERWVFEEVLPSIRKTGGYGKSAFDPATMSRMDLLKLAMDAEQERLQLESKVHALEPKAAALDRFAGHDGQHNVRNSSKLLGVREKLFIRWCIANDWLYRGNAGRLCAKAEKIAAGYLDTVPVEIHRSNGIQAVPQPVITQKGLAKLAVLLARDGLLPKKEEAA